MFGCDQSIIKGTLPGKQCTFAAYLNVYWKHLPITPQLALPAHSLQTMLSLLVIGQ